MQGRIGVRRLLREGLHPRRLVALLLLFYLLVFSLALMRQSIGLLGPGFSGLLSSRISSVPSAIGYSWIASMLMLSGSPVAAMAVGLQTSHVIDGEQLFAAVLGSRMGAVSIIFVLGIISLFAGRKKQGLATAMEVLVTTFVMVAGAMAIGYAYLRLVGFAPVVTAPGVLAIPGVTLTANFIVGVSGAATALVLSVALLVFTIRSFDKTLRIPKEYDVNFHELMKHPLIGFSLGFLLTAIFFTISISFSLLIPLATAGRISRREVIPYVIGGNIGTFSDTMILAALTGSRDAAAAVTADIFGNLVMGLLLLLFIGRFSGFVTGTTDFLLKPRNAAFIMLLMIAVPAFLVIV